MKSPFRSEDERLKARLDDSLRLRVLVRQLTDARKQIERKKSHKRRNALLLLGGASLVMIGIAPVRRRITSLFGADTMTPPAIQDVPATVEEQIEVDVPVSTAYNQWTQFEEFPKFMEGVERVEQLDDTLLHWVGKVAGKRAEWDAKILEQEPDRKISWKSVGGKPTEGTVSSSPQAPKTKVRLQMRYQPEGIREKVGAVAGLDKRRSAATWSASRSSSRAAARRRAAGGARCTPARSRAETLGRRRPASPNEHRTPRRAPPRGPSRQASSRRSTDATAVSATRVSASDGLARRQPLQARPGQEQAAEEAGRVLHGLPELHRHARARRPRRRGPRPPAPPTAGRGGRRAP